jgi:glycosyltransferase involved in cell wall biosynthesis
VINFVTNQSIENTSGGWSGISANIYNQMQNYFDVTYVGPIDPPIPFASKLISKALRTAGARGGLPVFGERRLDSIKRTWRTSRNSTASFDLFHAATPWTTCRPNNPYGAYIDATFSMYMDIYSSPKTFSAREMEEISNRERDWMRGADALFFGSAWVRDIAVKEYGLDVKKTHVSWVGGNVPLPPDDTFRGGHTFLFIALNFEKKGGRIAADALERVRESVPEANLLVLGERPPEDVMARPGIRYGGMLSKTIPQELADFVEHLSNARALIHPTSMDTMGAVLIEAGYYGCPSIATRRFGIPELIKERETGYLLDVPISVDEVVSHMFALCSEGPEYSEMRREVRKDMIKRLTWDAFGERMAAVIGHMVPSATAIQR